MAWIPTIPPHEADGELKAVYDKVGKARGRVAEIFRVSSVNPATMSQHLDFYVSLMFGPSDLTPLERELLATAVSATNGCHY